MAPLSRHINVFIARWVRDKCLLEILDCVHLIK